MKFETAFQNNANVDFSSGTTSVIQQPVVSARLVSLAQLHARRGTQGNSASRPTTARRHGTQVHATAQPHLLQHHVHHSTANHQPASRLSMASHLSSAARSSRYAGKLCRQVHTACPSRYTGTRHSSATPSFSTHVHHSTAKPTQSSQRLSTASHLSSAARSSRYAGKLCRQVHHSTSVTVHRYTPQLSHTSFSTTSTTAQQTNTVQPVVSARPVTLAQLHARHGTQGNSAGRSTTARPSRYTGTRHSLATPPSAQRPPQHGQSSTSRVERQHQHMTHALSYKRYCLSAGIPEKKSDSTRKGKSFTQLRLSRIILIVHPQSQLVAMHSGAESQNRPAYIASGRHFPALSLAGFQSPFSAARWPGIFPSCHWLDFDPLFRLLVD